MNRPYLLTGFLVLAACRTSAPLSESLSAGASLPRVDRESYEGELLDKEFIGVEGGISTTSVSLQGKVVDYQNAIGMGSVLLTKMISHLEGKEADDMTVMGSSLSEALNKWGLDSTEADSPTQGSFQRIFLDQIDIDPTEFVSRSFKKWVDDKIWDYWNSDSGEVAGLRQFHELCEEAAQTLRMEGLPLSTGVCSNFIGFKIAAKHHDKPKEMFEELVPHMGPEIEHAARQFNAEMRIGTSSQIPVPIGWAELFAKAGLKDP